MATTFEDVFRIMLSNMDEIQPDGIVSGDTRDEYEQKSFEIATQEIRKLLKDGDLYSTYEISKEYIIPVISDFNINSHNTEDVIKESNKVCRAYYFEVNGPATIYIEDFTTSWNILETITVPATVEAFTAYKGLIIPTAGATKTRIRFSGTTYYNFTNHALFEESFASVARIPDHRPFVKYDMPSDFKSVERIIEETYPQQYQRDADYKWEGRNSLYLAYHFRGNVRIIYYPVPDPITASTDVIPLDDVTATTVLPDAITARILASENPDLANLYLSLTEEGKQELQRRKPPQSSNRVNDEY